MQGGGGGPRPSATPASSAAAYERHECIGRGSFGDVFRGIDRASGEPVAIKVIYLEEL
jgi:serine/threonine protein kinase